MLQLRIKGFSVSWFIHITLNLTPESEAYIGKIGVKRALGKVASWETRLEVEFHNRWAQGSHESRDGRGHTLKGHLKMTRQTACLKNVPRSVPELQKKAGFFKTSVSCYCIA